MKRLILLILAVFLRIPGEMDTAPWPALALKLTATAIVRYNKNMFSEIKRTRVRVRVRVIKIERCLTNLLEK